MSDINEVNAALNLRKSASLATLIQRSLEGRILSGEIKAGERLNEAALAEEFGVSRGPIREAARLLERSNLVESIANRGSYVRKIPLKGVLDIYDLRASLTWLACGAAAEKRNEDDLAVLLDLVEQMDAAAEVENTAEYYDLNIRFHRELTAIADNQRMAETYDGLVKEAHLFRQASLVQHEEMAASNIEHRAIVTAIVAGDVDAARAAGFAHVAAGKERFLREFQKTQLLEGEE